MAAALGLPLEPLELVLERSEGPAGLPKAEPVSIDFPNDHLSYAITWYGLALVLLVDLHPVQLHQARHQAALRPIRTTAAVTAILVYALIVLGAVVRTTNSGLSCPDWPTCYGHWVPLPSDLAAVPNIGYTYGQVMLEWVHRLIAGVFVGPLVLLLAVLTFLRRRERPDLAIAGAALVVLLLVQGALGGLTVLDRNSPWSVAIHLGNALLVLTVTLRIFTGAAGWSGDRAARRLLAPAAVAWCLALLAMMSAAMTAKSGASLACATWPSCNGALVPDLGDYCIRIHFTHRVLAAADRRHAALPVLAQPLRRRRRCAAS